MQPWAITATAGDVDASARADAARDMQRWLDDGGAGIALVTCHRAELYGFGARPSVTSARTLEGPAAIEHLLRVACGLESVIVGEDEVLHQVREALARGSRSDRRIHRVFETAIAAGRKARSRRTASSGNLAEKAVAWLRARADLSGRMVIVAGAGRMGSTLAHSLAEAGADVVVSSRDSRRAEMLASMYAGRGTGLEAGARLARKAAGVAVALGGPWTELESLPGAALPPIADISAPQAVPDQVRRGMNGNFLGIDDMYRQTAPLPGAYIKDAERLVAARTADYMAWLERAR